MAIDELQGKLSCTEKALTKKKEELLSLRESNVKEAEGKQVKEIDFL